jgi:hypothetical protein
MEEDQNDNKGLWNVFLIVTIVAAAIITILIVKREAIFPSKYPSAHREKASETEAKTENPVLSDSTKKVADDPQGSTSSSSSKPETLVLSNDENGRYALVTGSFHSPDNASNLITTLKKNYPESNPSVVEFSVDSVKYYRVVLAKSSKFSELNTAKRKLIDAGYADAWITEK